MTLEFVVILWYITGVLGVIFWSPIKYDRFSCLKTVILGGIVGPSTWIVGWLLRSN